MRKSNHKVVVSTLPNGMRIGYRHLPQAAVEYCGVVVCAGSRDDGADRHGLAHFVEHTIFKGTQRRKSWHIINRMERVGGELNAYTTKEETVVYTAAPSGNLRRAMELIFDLISNSRFPQAELDKEREVVADEINSYLDSPADAVFDDFEELIFSGTPLAHNILGNSAALETFDSSVCCEYLHRWYVAGNMSVFYSGPLGYERVAGVMSEYFGSLPAIVPQHERLKDFRVNESFSISRDIHSHQAHTVMGTIIGSMYAPERYSMSLISNILGGPGMNSLLNMALRERRGYVYSVEASTAYYTDCGLFTIYFGCDPDDVAKCCDLVRKQISDLAQHPILPSTLAQAKKQYLGQMAVGSDNHENQAISTGRAALYYGNILTQQEISQIINNITIQDITCRAKELADLSTLTLQ